MVSIVIAVFNAEKYIEETINSVINQTYTEWELIVVNDGSNDNTSEIIKKFISDSRIKVIEKPNSGVSDSRNQGMKHIKGDYISLLDADDLWLPWNLEKKMEFFSLNPDVEWAFSDVTEFFEDGSEKEKILLQSTDYLLSLLLWDAKVLTAPSGLIFHRKCFDMGCRFDCNFSTAADQDFCIQLASKYKAAHIPLILWKYRVLKNSMSSNIRLMEKDHIAVLKKAKSSKLYSNNYYRRWSFAKLYFILAGSWIVNKSNYSRGIYFLVLSFFSSPIQFYKLIKIKTIKRINR